MKGITLYLNMVMIHKYVDYIQKGFIIVKV